MSNLIEIKKVPDAQLIAYLEELLIKAKTAEVTGAVILTKEVENFCTAMYGLADTEDAIRFVGHLELSKQNIVLSVLSEAEAQ